MWIIYFFFLLWIIFKTIKSKYITLFFIIYLNWATKLLFKWSSYELFITVISIFLSKLHHEIKKYSERERNSHCLWKAKIFLSFSWSTVKTSEIYGLKLLMFFFFFLTDWIAIVQSLPDAIQTDSNLITQEGVWEVAITEEQRLWALVLYQTHSYLLCALCCACKQYYEKEKKTVHLGGIAFSRLSRQIVLPLHRAPLRNFNVHTVFSQVWHH